MRADGRRVEEDGSKTDDLLLLECEQDAIHYTALAPTLEADVYGVPVAVLFRQLSPGTARGEHVQERVQDLPMRE